MGEKIRIIIEIIKRGILELLYPKDSKCILCQREDEEGICFRCRSKIKGCSDNEELCIGYYKGPLKELILKLKCKKDYVAGEVLVNLIEEKIVTLDTKYYLTYIPSSHKSLKERGFNQCEYIAKELAFRNNFKVVNTLVTVREVKSQKTLSKEERFNNLYGTFQVRDRKLTEGRNFILIDDVVTTGATLAEGIRALKENGAEEIKILTLAKSHI